MKLGLTLKRAAGPDADIVVTVDAAASEDNPFLIPPPPPGIAPEAAAGVVAREVSIWVGAATSMRGRGVKASYAEPRDAFDREQAETRAQNE